MNVESAFNKILNPVEKHSGLIAAGAFVARPTVIDGIMDSVQRIASGQIHGLEVNNYISFLTKSSQSNFIPAIAAAIAGYFLQDATGNSTVKKIGAIAQGFGTAYAAAEAIYGALWYTTHSPVANTSGGQPSNVANGGYGY